VGIGCGAVSPIDQMFIAAVLALSSGIHQAG
jgi:hypothetical protein